MEQNNSVAGQQEAGPSGVLGSIQNGGENNNQGAAAAAVFVSGHSGLLAAGIYTSGVAAGDVPNEFAALSLLATVAVGDDPSGYAAAGPSGVAAAAGVPSGVAGLSSNSSTGKRKRNYRHSEYQINEMESYFKNNQHPNGFERNELAIRLGLDCAQVKFWFQNKRTQVKNQCESDENDALQAENDALRARKQQLIEAMRKNTCSLCSVGGSRPTIDNLRSENSHLIKEVESLKSRIVGFMARQNQQNLPNLPLISNVGNANSYPVDQGPGPASTSFTSFVKGVHSINVPTTDDFRQSLIELVVLAAGELKAMSMYMEPLWNSSTGVDGTTSVLNEEEYRSRLPDNFGPMRPGYTCEASRHTSRVLMSPTKLLNILMDVNEWAFTFSDIVGKALTLDLLSEGVNHNAALQVMAAEYHVPTPLVPNRRTYFARYCTQHSEGVWVVVDVSIDKILPTPDSMTCQKRPSGCLIQGMSDGTSKITWIEHVYTDYTGVGTIYKRLLRS
ncbi:homeobox-leucine zipper protein MERISTEM L1-like [Apium graveolens]|uniref:homeobox-leucine zipper protein MERISTEM L1-like n=1 Tax=Apium graveolens TaxID=4045 RepID=UPI003D7A497E